MPHFGTIKGQDLIFLMFLWFVWFMNFSIRTVFAPLLPLIEDEFAIQHARASSFFVYNALGYGTALILAGLFAGHFGYKRSIIFSLVVAAGAFFLIPFVESFGFLCALSLVLGLASGIYLPSIIPLITNVFEMRSWGKAIAIHDSAASVSIFAAPFIALFFLGFTTWRTIFIFFGAVALINLIIFGYVVRELKIDRPLPSTNNHLLRQRALWIIALIWIFASGTNLGVYFILPLYLIKELQLESVYANEIFGISRIGGVFVAIAVGFIVDRFSLKKTMFALVLTTGLLTVCLTLAQGRALEILLFLQAAVGFGFFPVGLVAISKLFGTGSRGPATGYIVTLGVIFGLGVIPYLLGIAGDYLSFRLGILILGVLGILSSGLTYFLKEID